MSFPIVVDQFFWPIKLNELIDHDKYQISVFISGVKTAKELADKVIQTIEYPFYLGQPDDTHILNCYHGKWCKKISLDFWQPASWTATIGIGDCEDSSILYVATAKALGIPDNKLYVVFGVVLDASSKQLLGGHAWVYISDPSFGDNKWRYVETTLDTPPPQYPPVPDITKPFQYNEIILVPEALWNSSEYKEVGKGVAYLCLRRKLRETRRKYEAIQKAFNITVKPLKKSRKSLLARIRWRI